MVWPIRARAVQLRETYVPFPHQNVAYQCAARLRKRAVVILYLNLRNDTLVSICPSHLSDEGAGESARYTDGNPGSAMISYKVERAHPVQACCEAMRIGETREK